MLLVLLVEALQSHAVRSDLLHAVKLRTFVEAYVGTAETVVGIVWVVIWNWGLILLVLGLLEILPSGEYGMFEFGCPVV